MIPLSAWLAQVFSVRIYLLTNAILFLALSVACAFAQSLGQMIVLRALQGLAGGFAAWAIIALAVLVLNIQLADLTGLYGTTFKLEWPDLGDTITLLVFAAVLGWLGGWLSVSRHLWLIQPQ